MHIQDVIAFILLLIVGYVASFFFGGHAKTSRLSKILILLPILFYGVYLTGLYVKNVNESSNLYEFLNVSRDAPFTEILERVRQMRDALQSVPAEKKDAIYFKHLYRLSEIYQMFSNGNVNVQLYAHEHLGLSIMRSCLSHFDTSNISFDKNTLLKCRTHHDYVAFVMSRMVFDYGLHFILLVFLTFAATELTRFFKGYLSQSSLPTSLFLNVLVLCLSFSLEMLPVMSSLSESNALLALYKNQWPGLRLSKVVGEKRMLFHDIVFLWTAVIALWVPVSLQENSESLFEHSVVRLDNEMQLGWSLLYKLMQQIVPTGLSPNDRVHLEKELSSEREPSKS